MHLDAQSLGITNKNRQKANEFESYCIIKVDVFLFERVKNVAMCGIQQIHYLLKISVKLRDISHGKEFEKIQEPS